MRRIGCLILLILALLIGGGAAWFVHSWVGTGPAREDTSFVVKDGATLRTAADALEEQELIGSADLFLAGVKLFSGAPVIKAGEYLVPARASNSQILSILTEGVGINRFVTVPEGMPSIMVRDRLMATEQLTGEVGVPPEGSVLPDTYAYDKGEPRAEVLARMQAAMTAALDAAWAKRSKRTVAQTKQEALTLASIVEKETAIPAERPMVAGVYTNRLRKGMMLQADPTIIYPITKGKPLGRRIRKSEITDVNDYNTYAMTGLPKGPIANPSLSSIEAVLNPAETPALYFVADGEGGHIFANTLEEHNANVKKWFAIRRERGEM